MRIALAVMLVALTSTEASAHCYSVWRYPFPQRCHAARQMARLQIPANSRKLAQIGSLGRGPSGPDIPNQERSKNKVASLVAEPDIALPSLARADLAEPEADEPTRARLLLRAALEAPNALQ